MGIIFFIMSDIQYTHKYVCMCVYIYIYIFFFLLLPPSRLLFGLFLCKNNTDSRGTWCSICICSNNMKKLKLAVC